MVDQPKCQTNRALVQDRLHLHFAPKRLTKEFLAEKYKRGSLSAAQLGEEVGLSKQAILGRLRAAGVSGTQGRGRSEENYRFPNPPYGYHVSNGRLMPNPVEMKTVRLIVEFRERREWSFNKVAMELNRRGRGTRQGRKWTKVSVRSVYMKWQEKV